MAAPIIGIDLGTTNSCAAVCDRNGEVQLIPYRGGEYTVPSIYAIDDKGNELVGHEAKRQWQLNPTNTVFGAKRLVGTNINSELVSEMRKHVAYEMVEVVFDINGEGILGLDARDLYSGAMMQQAVSFGGDETAG